MARNPQRFNKDTEILSDFFGVEKVFWAKDMSWVLVKDFPLPENFKTRTTNVLVIVPESYGFGGCFEDVFIDPGLELLDKDGRNYRKLDSDVHGFREVPYGRLAHIKDTLAARNWFYLCLHDNDPLSSLLSYLYKINLYLANPYTVWA